MAKKNWYAVRVGRKPGIYTSWDNCKAQVSGFEGALYKGFYNHADAQAFVDGTKPSVPDGIYTDGSYNDTTGMAGSAFICVKDNTVFYSETLKHRDTYGARNIMGECIAVVRACIRYADITSGLRANLGDVLHIYHDLVGVKHWANGSWKRNTEITKRYHEMMSQFMCEHKVVFHHVPGHSGNWANELADKEARKACKG